MTIWPTFYGAFLGKEKFEKCWGEFVLLHPPKRKNTANKNSHNPKKKVKRKR